MSMSNFGNICKSVAKILRFFNSSKWQATPSWIFKFVKFHWQTVSGRPRLIIVLNVVKVGGYVMETLHFFEFSKWPMPPSWIFEIAKFYWLLGRRGLIHISMPNFVKIVQSVEKILRFFFYFSIWRPPPSWIVKFTKFYWLTVAGGPRRITLPNFVNVGRSTAEMLQFMVLLT